MMCDCGYDFQTGTFTPKPNVTTAAVKPEDIVGMALDPGYHLLSWLIESIPKSISDRERVPFAALGLGVLSVLVTLLVPFITIPLPMLGLVLSRLGRNSSQRKWAIAGGLLCVLSLVLNLMWLLIFLVLAISGP
jgi:hypothetical protein